MPKSTFVDFKSVKAAITMEAVLEHYDLIHRFKRSGDSLSGPCPIHKGDNPTQFRVSISKNVWHCFSECKHGGNSLDFIAKMEGVSIHAAALLAIEWFSLDREVVTAKPEPVEENHKAPRQSVPPSLPKPVARKPEPAAASTAPNKPLQFRLEKLQGDHPYLAERGLTLETVAKFGLGYCAKGVMAGRIAIPIQNVAGEVVAYAGRLPGEPTDSEPKYKLPQGFKKSQELFNIHRAKEVQGPLIVVEGFFDVMKLDQLGHRKVVALMGSSMSAAQEEIIRKHTTLGDKILVMLDEDDAGRAARDDIALRLAWSAFVRIHDFAQIGQQPEHMTPEEVAELFT